MKQYVGIIRDHSGSMGSYRLGPPAARDYNSVIADLKRASAANGIDTVVTTVKCGVNGAPGGFKREVVNSSVNALQPMSERDYDTRGGCTPLFDSVGDLIELFKQVPDFNDQDVTFLIMATTDGEDNASPKWKLKIAQELRELQSSDRWTFVFRVPKGYNKTLENFGVHPGNICPWDQTEQALHASTIATTSAIDNFYVNLSRGIRSSTRFYADAENISKEQVAATLKDISREVRVELNEIEPNIWISDFCTRKFGRYRLGTGFYEHTKPEKVVQGHKLIVVRDKVSGETYAGVAARQMLGLPDTTVRVDPGKLGRWEIYIQSQSMNRYVPLRAKVLVWESARVM